MTAQHPDADARPPRIDIVVEDDAWGEEAALAALAARALAAAAAHEGEDLADEVVTILFTSDAEIAELNGAHRGKQKPTNVLSFPSAEMPLPPGEPRPLGDIALAFATVAEEARLEGKPFAHHVTHLIIHGFLHLLGHDHEEEGMAEEMEAAERAILATLDIPDPYR